MEHPDGRHAGRELAGWPPEGGVRRRPQVEQQPGAERVEDRGAQVVAPDARDRAEAGERHVAGQTVGRDAVGGANDPEERGRDGDPPGRPAAGRRREAGQAEVVIEHAGVDDVRACGRRRTQAGVARHEVCLGWAEPEGGRGALGSRRAVLDERLEDPLPGVGEAGNPRLSRSSEAPRVGAALPSLGGSRISTGARLVAVRHVAVIGPATFSSLG